VQQRVIFAIAAVPLAAGALGARSRGTPALRRAARFFGAAVVLAALAITSPFDPRIPHVEHMQFTIHGFVIPLVGTAILLAARDRWLLARTVEETTAGTALVGALLAVAFLLASAIGAGEVGRMLFDVLTS
jgi:hypothetical protein